jgi:flagellar L-ring protein precursor FlgH
MSSPRPCGAPAAPPRVIGIAAATRALLLAGLIVSGCGRLDEVGRAPAFSPIEGTNQHHSIYAARLPVSTPGQGPARTASLWSSDGTALFADRRAARRGDILTVVIEIDDKAEISNSSNRSRTGSLSAGVPQFLGAPQAIDRRNADRGWTMAEAVSTNGESTFSGQGAVRRNEKMTLRIAATVVEELANGVLRIEGEQEVRVNSELRQLLVVGFVRPGDISRQNEIAYDKIAGARVAYGGRGLVSDAQAPTWGQQIADIVLPF